MVTLRWFSPGTFFNAGGCAICEVAHHTSFADSRPIIRAADFCEEGSMHGPIIKECQKLNLEDQKTFRRWTWAMIGVLALVVCVVVAIESSITLEQRSAILLQAGMFPEPS